VVHPISIDWSVNQSLGQFTLPWRGRAALVGLPRGAAGRAGMFVPVPVERRRRLAAIVVSVLAVVAAALAAYLLIHPQP
jgi:hypothetical protein